MFRIGFINKELSVDKKRSNICYGKIILGNFFENFIVDLFYWDRLKYSNQWKEGLKRILGKFNKSCLLTSMYQPDKVNFIKWWEIHKINTNIHFHETILPIFEMKEIFDEINIYKYINDYKNITDDGEAISEWIIPIKEVEVFYSEIKTIDDVIYI